MAARIIMPKLGLEMTEGTVVAWSFKEGDRVNKGAVILQIETEKITYEVEAPASGILRKIFAREGERRPIGELLGVITADDETFDERELVVEKVSSELGAFEEPKPVLYGSEGAVPRPKQAEMVGKIIAKTMATTRC